MAGMRYQPQGAAQIDRLNPITRGLRIATSAGTGHRNIVNGREFTALAGKVSVVEPNSQGVGWSSVGAAGWRGMTDPSEDLFGIDEATMMVAFVVTETVGAADTRSHTLVSYGGVAGSNVMQYGHAIIVPNYTSQRGLRASWRVTGYSTISMSANTVLVRGMVGIAIATYQRNGTCELYLNGQVVTTMAGPDKPLDLSTIQGGGIVVAQSDTLGPFSVLGSGTWDRRLSADEIASLSANPWQLFRSSDETDDLPATAVQRVLAIAAAALALTGGQVRMAVSRRLAVAPASLSVVAGQVAMRAARRLQVDRAAFTLAPGQLSMLAARRLGIQPTALQLVGGGIGMRAARRLQVAPASLVLTAGQVEMMYAHKELPGGYTLPVSAAAVILGGGDVRMRVSRRLAVAPARLGLVSGAVRVLVGRRLLVSPARLELVGRGVTLRFSAESPPFDISKIHPARIVVFEGSGSRVTVFDGSGSRVIPFEGSGSRVTPFEGSGNRLTRFE